MVQKRRKMMMMRKTRDSEVPEGLRDLWEKVRKRTHIHTHIHT